MTVPELLPVGDVTRVGRDRAWQSVLVVMSRVSRMPPDMPPDVTAHVAAAEMPASAVVHVCPL